MKWSYMKKPSIVVQLSIVCVQQQDKRRRGLLIQLEAMRFLLRQGIVLRGHTDKESNLYQLSSWSKDNEYAKRWLSEAKYMSHDIVNELLTTMGHTVLRSILSKIKATKSCVVRYNR